MTYAEITKFARFQVASVLATAVDFSITIVLKELCAVHYLPATSIGTLSGGIANFLISRNYVFRASGHSAFRQVFRYVVTWSCSILLNILFVYLLTSIAGFNYILSKIITAVIIGITFNYSLQRKFVFVGSIKSSHNDKVNRII